MKKANTGVKISRHLLSTSIYKIILIVGLFLLICNPSRVASQSKNSYHTLREAHAFADNGKVVITAFKAIRYSGIEKDDLFRDIKIYRLLCPDFVFGTDYEEYFHGLSYTKGELVFQGNIDPILGCKYRFVDESAKTNAVYAYWIASSEGEPLGPLPVKIRDTDVWWSHEKVMNCIEKMKNSYPEYVKVEEIGFSVNRKPLIGLQVGKGKPVVALIGAIHAGEAGPELIIPILEKLVEQNLPVMNKISVIAIPSINCDNRDNLVYGNPWYLRRNANLVDLNRNFPSGWDNVSVTYGYKTSDPDGLTYRGPFAASEPETGAVMNYLKRYKPGAVFSFHCLAGICGETLLTSKISSEDTAYVSACYQYSKSYWEGIDSQLLKNQKVHFGCDNGSLPDWCYRELRIPAFDIEGPVDPCDLAKCAVDGTDVNLLHKYQERLYDGFVKLLSTLQ